MSEAHEIPKRSLRPGPFALAVLMLGLASTAFGVETYVQTEIDPNGQLHILTKRHREIVPRKEHDQIGFAKAEISPDGRAVGWLAMFPDCCESDPVALKLVIYAGDDTRTFTGTGLP